MIPAVFQVTFAAIITGTIALLFEHPWTATPGRRGDLLDPVARDPRLRPRLPGRLPAVRGLGRDTDHARRVPASRSSGSSLGYLVLQEPVDARIIVGTGLVIAGIGLVNSRSGGGGCSGGRRPTTGRGRLAAGPGRAPRAPLSSRPRAAAPRRRSAPTPRSGGPPRNGRSPRPAGPSPTPRRRPSPIHAGAPRPTTAPRSARPGCTGRRSSVSQPPTAARRAAAGP